MLLNNSTTLSNYDCCSNETRSESVLGEEAETVKNCLYGRWEMNPSDASANEYLPQMTH
jgi:hypothetical protein